jgi:hypothetical protein
MIHLKSRRESARRFQAPFAILFAILLIPGEAAAVLAQQPAAAPAAAPDQAKKLPPDALDSLVAPIALYPDPLLAQTLAASTYPLEIVQLQQWLAKHPDLKDKALVDAVAKEPFDPSVQSMAAFPDVLKRLGDDIQWTNDLGNAFLAQQSDVMDAVQRMRKKAQDKGKLESNKEQKVETQVIEKKEVIVIQPAQPDVIYVPSYDPVVVYGPPAYPYYPYPYWPYYPVGAAFVSFGFGVAMGAFWGGVWGGCGWGNNTININNNNNFNRVEHRGDRGQGNRGDRGQGNRGDRGQGGRGDGGRGGGDRGGGNWSHNPSHRGGTPYGDRATANKFGGNARGDSLANRQSANRVQSAQSGLARSEQRAGAGARGGAGVSDRSAGAGNRGGGAGSGRGGGDFNRSGSGDRVGSRDVGRSGGSRGASGLGGSPSGGFSGSSARQSSSRGSSSFSGSRGGGGRGGGGRGGGGRR